MAELMFTWQQMVEATGGEWLGGAPTQGAGVVMIGTDSREAGPGTMFIALTGGTRDGHEFLEGAAGHGAAAVCVQHALGAERLAGLRQRGVGCLLVPDTLAAYQALARAHRRRYPALTVVGVTGSCGKTSTKEMIAAVLEARFPGRVLKTAENTNNQIGVPQNLRLLTAEHRAAVIEMGTNHPGEIAPLAATTEPTISVLTNVGPVHLEGFGDENGVAREKANIFNGLAARQGWGVLPHKLRAHPALVAALAGTRALTTGPEPEAEVRVTYRPAADGGAEVGFLRRDRAPLPLTWLLGGEHQALNAAAAVAVATIVGIPDVAVQEALAGVRLPGMRMQWQEGDGVKWLNDAYNGNPASMKALAAWLSELGAGPGTLYLVLGDMFELGPANVAPYHQAVLAYVRQTLPRAVIVPVGTAMKDAAPTRGLTGFDTVAEARAELLGRLRPGDTVVLKGSRGMHLEGMLPDSLRAAAH